MKPRVFVSSTVYDLLDVRAEVECILREMGMEPVLSDSATSDFRVCPDRNSIESCLVNVRASDYLIVILSRRYGPSLAAADFDDLSATHLEYRTAIADRKPVLFYVRDRLEAEYSAWHRNKGQLDLTWIDVTKDSRIFELIEEHKRLSTAKVRSNWFQTFRTSVDLKNLIHRDLQLPASRASLERAIQQNHIPLLSGTVKIMHNRPNFGKFMPTFRFANMGTVPAYNVLPCWGNDKPDIGQAYPVIAPNDSLTQTMVCDMPEFKERLLIEYQTPEGHVVVDEFNCAVRIETGETLTTVKLVSKTYRPGEKMPFTLKEYV